MRRRERLPELPNAPYIELAPDWVCEVLSSSTQRHDRVRKMRVYARERVKHVWLVDPEAQVLEVLRLEQDNYLIALRAAEAERVRAEPFDAIELDLAVLWAR